MKTIQKELLLANDNPLTEELFTENAIFFDIETTGFSPSHTTLYLIGCARRKDKAIYIDQFFAEHPCEENLILNAFLALIRNYDTIITYNGIGFDLPYLKAKCEKLHLSENFSNFNYVDIFKSASKLKHIFKLENYKQKTLENFLGISRDDLYSGGELIQIYKNYIKSPDADSFNLLLLHNYEDIIGMMDLIQVLSYTQLFQGNLSSLQEAVLSGCKNYDGSRGTELLLKFIPKYPLPQRISYRFHDIYLSGKGLSISLMIKVTAATLKFFYPNYKEYYYLPLEDTAVHKSVAAFVDKKYRCSATAATCYTKKEGKFLPQYNSTFITPAFFRTHSDKVSYFELTDQFCTDDGMLLPYIQHLLSVLSIANYKI